MVASGSSQLFEALIRKLYQSIERPSIDPITCSWAFPKTCMETFSRSQFQRTAPKLLAALKLRFF
jgi:hypothetical protein